MTGLPASLLNMSLRISFYVCLMLFCVGSFVYNLFCTLLLVIPITSKRVKIQKVVNVWLIKTHIKIVSTLGLWNLQIHLPCSELPEGRCIVIANHTGLFDAIVMNALIPDMTCIFKGKLSQHPCFSSILKCSGHISNNDGIDVIRNATEVLEEDGKIVIFPEGTRQTEVTGFDFKAGFAMIAQRANAPIVMVSIKNPGKAFSKELGLFGSPKLPFHYEFEHIGTITPRNSETSAQLLERVVDVYKTHFSDDENSPPSAACC